ncbi:hypothetical protein LZZ90_00180 [Flavobacterium sp. SM15]|uniref:tetratricopeptide repeat protein n=1 Tax=Flavobacterium sp. SM15 TaxID=2908005 RepID=UPI001EDB95DE|nr:hypothetical protein [Flavobacterium sp. SM15]MCG2609918.1 hypothetical protein [Flavobacterium sp. SM15]
MKKILLTTFLLIFSSLQIFANDFNANYDAALKFKKEANYQEAVRYFLKALKTKEDDSEVAQSLCFEIADCFLKQGNERQAVKFLKVAVRNYGATLTDIEQNKVLKKEFLSNAVVLLESDYNELRRTYLLKTNFSERKKYADLD